MRIPAILQSDRGECGLACLAMVAAYYGHRLTLREYRARFRISERGTTLRTLRNYAEQLGFKCRAVRAELEAISQLRCPAILHWKLDHFVVLESVGRRSIKIIDPAIGMRRISREEFSKHYTGIALELMPTVALKQAKPANTLSFGAFLPVFRGLGKSLATIFLMTLALQIFVLVLPLNLQFTMDQGVRRGDFNIVMAMGLGFALITVISAIAEWLRTLLVQYVANTSAFRMLTGLAHHLLSLPDAWFTARHTGDVISRFQSTTPIGEFVMTGAFKIFVDLTIATGALAILIVYSMDLTLVAVVAFCAIAITKLGTFGRLRSLTHELIEAQAREQSSFIENVERQRAIKLLGAETMREDAWNERLVESLNSNARLVRLHAHIDLTANILSGLEAVVILMLGAGKVINGHFTVGMLLAFTSYASIFSTRAHELLRAWVDVRMLRLHQERIADIALEAPENPPSNKGVCKTVRGCIEVHSLCFSYSTDGPRVLDHLDLKVAPGEFVAIQGKSGAGKSTLIKLLSKLLKPKSGSIQIDGVEIGSLDTEHFRQQLGVVMQDDDLFTGSLLENIAMDEGQADMRQVEEAARIACINEDIDKMPMGYLSLIGHMGSSLSGGQRQRLMIARAIYRRPSLLLLDEATAHIDGDLQQQVLANLIGTGATIIAVSHDDRVLAHADQRILLRSANANT